MTAVQTVDVDTSLTGLWSEQSMRRTAAWLVQRLRDSAHGPDWWTVTIDEQVTTARQELEIRVTATNKIGEHLYARWLLPLEAQWPRSARRVRFYGSTSTPWGKHKEISQRQLSTYAGVTKREHESALRWAEQQGA